MGWTNPIESKREKNRFSKIRSIKYKFKIFKKFLSILKENDRDNIFLLTRMFIIDNARISDIHLENLLKVRR